MSGVHYYMTDLGDEHEHPVGQTLRRYFELQVTPEVRARHTMSIHREAAKIRLAERRAVRAARRPRRAVVASLVGAMLVGSSTGALAASDDSLPGDMLYPVKRGTEQARLFAAVPFSAVGPVHLDIAQTRVEEAGAVAHERPADVPQLVVEAEEALAAAEREGVDVAAVAPELAEAAGRAITVAVNTAPDEVIGLLPPDSPALGAAGAVPSPSPTVAAVQPSAAPSDGATVAPSPGADGSPDSGTVGLPVPTPAVPGILPESSTVGLPLPLPTPSPTPTAAP